MVEPLRKYVSGTVVADASLSDRQIRVIANSGKADRVKDTLVAAGCKLDNYVANPIVLADHNPEAPIGNFAPEIKDALEGVITFAPAGASAKADEYCALYKAGVMRTVSVGFQPIEYEPNKAGGTDFKAWELLELSCVAVPCDPGAVVTARALGDAPEPRWKCGASLTLPVREARDWTPIKATQSIFGHADFEGAAPDLAFARKGFLVYDNAAPRDAKSYSHPFAEVVGGRLCVSEASVRSARRALAEHALPDDVAAKARAVLDHYEAQMKSSDAKPVTRASAPKIKGLYDVATLAECLMRLGYIHSNAVSEAAWEGDDSQVPAMLANALKVLADAFLAMSREEVAELLAGHDVEIDVDDPYVMAAEAPETKRLRTALRKAGRVLSAENEAHVKAIVKCFGKAMECQAKAIDSHGQTADQLADFVTHLNEGAEHAKALMKSRRKPKPAEDEPDDGEVDPDDDDEADVELAAEADRRKRLIEIAAASVA